MPRRKRHRVHKRNRHLNQETSADSDKKADKLSSLGNVPERQHSPCNHCCGEHKEKPPKTALKKLLRQMKRGEPITAIVGLIVLSLYTCYAGQQVVASNQATERANRAWVTAITFQTASIGENGEISVNAFLQNSGHSPAIGWYACAVADYPGITLPAGELDRLATRNSSSSLFVIAAGGPASSSMRLPYTVSKEHLVEIKSGERHLFIFGKIEYDDGFGHTRHTRFSDYAGPYPANWNEWFQSPTDNSAD